MTARQRVVVAAPEVDEIDDAFFDGSGELRQAIGELLDKLSGRKRWTVSVLFTVSRRSLRA
jgi:hypothetical protein